jgi:hypothetical protein
MNYTTVENPTWTRDGTMIDCVVDFVNLGKVPFTASPNDVPHSVEIYNRCVSGDFGPVGAYVPGPDEGPQPPTPFNELPDFIKIRSTSTGGANPNPNEVL